MVNARAHKLKPGARLTLFLVSYLPLFLISAFFQIYNYQDYLYWGGFNKESLFLFVKYFGAVSILVALSVFGVTGLVLLIQNVRRRALTSGEPVEVLDIENKNTESISYLFTYLIPFVFQDLSDLPNVFAVAVLLVVTFLIYSHSSMLLVNPTISLRYSLYMIEYRAVGSERKRKGMILSENRFLEEGDRVRLKAMGYKLYFAVDLGD